MKRLCVSAIANRIYDANISKKDPNLMLENGRTDRTDEVVNAAILYFRNVPDTEKVKILKLMGVDKQSLEHWSNLLA